MQKTNFFTVTLQLQAGREDRELTFDFEPSREDIVAALELEVTDREAIIETADNDDSGDQIDNEFASDEARRELSILRLYIEVVKLAAPLTASVDYRSVVTPVNVAGTKIGCVTVTSFQAFSKNTVDTNRAIQELTA